MLLLSKWDENKRELTEQFKSFDVITINGWQLKISCLGKQVMVMAMHPIFDETEVQFFQDFVKAHAWIEMITNDWYDDNY
tara:strand:- start:134 stop:373 length:240 start_codon:yes stop_codon:yes gene_type:complete